MRSTERSLETAASTREGASRKETPHALFLSALLHMRKITLTCVNYQRKPFFVIVNP